MTAVHGFEVERGHDASVRSRGPERGYDTRVGSRVAASSWGSLPRTAAEATTPRQPLPGAPPEAPRRCIHAPCGIVEGWIDGEVLRATGIRYARAARFGEPAPEPDADGILDATAWSPAAPQYPDLALEAMFGAQQRPLRMDEHCQYLSVTAPADLAPGEELPVMVWIHGGSYLTGAGDSGATDPAELVAEQRVVVVTVTYRLGLLGYPGGGARGSNLGLLDQAQALRWVRRNIAAFGGNAQQVTGFGESAGGDAIAHLLLAFPDERLMDRAIIQSAPLGIMRGRGPMTAAMNALADTAAPDATLADLGHLQEVITAKVAGNSLRYGLRTGMPWGVQYAAPPLPPEEQVLDSWQDAAGIPLLIGTTAAEVTLFTEPMAVMRAMRRLPIVGVRLHDALVRRLTRAIFDDGADALARRWVAGGGTVSRYRMTWSAAGNPIGSPHGLDVALLFAREDNWQHVVALQGSTWADVHAAGRALRTIWAAFARGDDAAVRTRGGVVQIESGWTERSATRF